MNAEGRLNHHFWGTYCATVVLVFDSGELAELARSAIFTAWKPGKNPAAIVYHGSDPELETQIALLAQYGADREKIASVAHSIDYGDPFTVTIDDDDPALQAYRRSLILPLHLGDK